MPRVSRCDESSCGAAEIAAEVLENDEGHGLDEFENESAPEDERKGLEFPLSEIEEDWLPSRMDWIQANASHRVVRHRNAADVAKHVVHLAEIEEN